MKLFIGNTRNVSIESKWFAESVASYARMIESVYESQNKALASRLEGAVAENVKMRQWIDGLKVTIDRRPVGRSNPLNIIARQGQEFLSSLSS